MGIGQQILVGTIWLYRLTLSGVLGGCCRFYPSCSAYAEESVRRHGALPGAWLAVRRLARCHPWCSGGLDAVPPLSEALPSASTPLPPAR